MLFRGFKKDLIIRKPVLENFKKYEQYSNRKESGGILLGKVYSSYVSIERITTPSIFDKVGRYFFIRSKIPAQSTINRLWSNSSGQTIYLGEWHTHPETNPSPSPQDRAMINNCFKSTKMEIDFLFLIIIGFSRAYWTGVQTEKGLLKLTLSNERQEGWA